MANHQTVYTLRNHPERAFTINATIEQASPEGAVIIAEVNETDLPPFTYRVEFGGEFAATKTNFTGEMYLHTAISVVQSQIESLQHRPTRLRVHHTSGLIHTEPLTA